MDLTELWTDIEGMMAGFELNEEEVTSEFLQAFLLNSKVHRKKLLQIIATDAEYKKAFGLIVAISAVTPKLARIQQGISNITGTSLGVLSTARMVSSLMPSISPVPSLISSSGSSSSSSNLGSKKKDVWSIAQKFYSKHGVAQASQSRSSDKITPAQIAAGWPELAVYYQCKFTPHFGDVFKYGHTGQLLAAENVKFLSHKYLKAKWMVSIKQSFDVKLAYERGLGDSYLVWWPVSSGKCTKKVGFGYVNDSAPVTLEELAGMWLAFHGKLKQEADDFLKVAAQDDFKVEKDEKAAALVV